MPLVLVNDGRRWACSLLTTAGATLILHLFTNDYIPVPGSVRVNFAEATFLGYAPVALGIANDVILNPQGNAQAYWPQKNFRCTAPGGAQTVYGYFVTTTLGVVLWAERNPAGGVVIQNAGDVFPVTPTLAVGALA